MDFKNTDDDNLNFTFEEKSAGKFMLDTSKLILSNVEVRFNSVNVFSFFKNMAIFSKTLGRAYHSFADFGVVENSQMPTLS